MALFRGARACPSVQLGGGNRMQRAGRPGRCLKLVQGLLLGCFCRPPLLLEDKGRSEQQGKGVCRRGGACIAQSSAPSRSVRSSVHTQGGGATRQQSMTAIQMLGCKTQQYTE